MSHAALSFFQPWSTPHLFFPTRCHEASWQCNFFVHVWVIQLHIFWLPVLLLFTPLYSVVCLGLEWEPILHMIWRTTSGVHRCRWMLTGAILSCEYHQHMIGPTTWVDNQRRWLLTRAVVCWAFKQHMIGRTTPAVNWCGWTLSWAVLYSYAIISLV